jgi:hypothetical protein
MRLPRSLRVAFAAAFCLVTISATYLSYAYNVSRRGRAVGLKYALADADDLGLQCKDNGRAHAQQGTLLFSVEIFRANSSASHVNESFPQFFAEQRMLMYNRHSSI